MGKTYYTEQQVATKLGITVGQLEGLIAGNRLRAWRAGQRRVFRTDEVDSLAGDDGGSDVGPEDASAITFSKADEAMLREYGTGTGLLDLTREVYAAASDGPAEPIGEATPAAQAATADPSTPAAPGQSEDATRQKLQIVGTALSLANRLVQVHKAESERARRGARLAWATAAALAIMGGVLLWLTTHQSGQMDVQQLHATVLREKLADAQSRLAQQDSRVTALIDELDAARADRRDLRAEHSRLLGELASAREALSRSKAAAELLKLQLAARAKPAAIVDQPGQGKATTQPATQPTSKPAQAAAWEPQPR